MKKIFKNPSAIVALYLIAFITLVIVRNFSIEKFLYAIEIFVLGGVLFFLLQKFFLPIGIKKFLNFSDLQIKIPNKNFWNFFISLEILFLLLNPPQKFFENGIENFFLIGAAILAILFFKFLPRYKRINIFNPVAAGLLCFSFFTSLLYEKNFTEFFVSWWGTGFGILSILALLPVIIYSTWKFKKNFLVLSFLIGNFIFIFFTEPIPVLKFIALDGTVYFLAAIMLAEPKTSPIKIFHQIIAGLLAVFIYRYFEHIAINNSELWAILSVNIFYFVVKKYILTCHNNFEV